MEPHDELPTIIDQLRQLLPSVQQRYCVASLGVFGSYVRRQQHEDSDVDVLVTFTDTPSLFKLIALEYELSDALGKKVDLVMRDALKPAIGRRILAEVVPI